MQYTALAISEHGMDKRIASADAAIEKLNDGTTILMGGFGLCGIPENLVAAVRRKGTKNLTIISNNAGMNLICTFPQRRFRDTFRHIRHKGGFHDSNRPA